LTGVEGVYLFLGRYKPTLKAHILFTKAHTEYTYLLTGVEVVYLFLGRYKPSIM
jgi:hypothetical protein